jgi:hypothetical protein
VTPGLPRTGRRATIRVVRRRFATLAAAAAALALALPAGAEAADGPCTAEARQAFPDGGGHVHSDPSQHRFSCRMQQVFFDSLADELAARPDVVLGEMDVKGDVAAIAVTYPEAGFLLYDVSEPTRPRFLSWFRSDECDQTVFDVNCGAFVDVSADATTVFLAIQTFTPFTVGRGTGQRSPTSVAGVQAVDVRDRANPRLAQAYPVGSEGGVHTARSHVIPADAPGAGPRDPGEYVFSIANGVGIDIAKVVSGEGGAKQLEPWNTIAIGEAHDTFIHNDPITGRTYLYIAGGFATGFYVFDVTDPADVTEIARWDLSPECPEDWYAHTIDVRVQDGKRIVTMPSEMLDLGEQLEEDQAEGCGRVWGNGDRPGPLWFVDATDFTDLAQPRDSDPDVKRKSEAALVTTWTNPAGRPGGYLTFSPHNQQIVGDRVFLSHYHAGVFVLDAAGALAGRAEVPREVAFHVPSEAEARPLYQPAVPPAQPFFSGHLGVRPDIWDMVYHRGHVIAADMVGGLYVLKPQLGRSPSERRPRVSLRTRFRPGASGGRQCALGSITLSLAGRDARRVRRADFLVGSRRIARDRRRPFRAVVRRSSLRRSRVNVLRARVTLRDGRRATISRRVLVC